jgi:hypothetical protein
VRAMRQRSIEYGRHSRHNDGPCRRHIRHLDTPRPEVIQTNEL